MSDKRGQNYLNCFLSFFFFHFYSNLRYFNWRKDADLMATVGKLDGEQSMVSKLQKQIKDLEGR